MKKLLLAALLLPIFTQAQDRIGNPGRYSYSPSGFMFSGLQIDSPLDTTAAKAAFPTLSMKGRRAWQGTVPYIHNGEKFVPFGSSLGYTPENIANRRDNPNATVSDTTYFTTEAVTELIGGITPVWSESDKRLDMENVVTGDNLGYTYLYGLADSSDVDTAKTAIRSEIADAKAMQTLTVYVDSAYGSDIRGEISNPARPFATVPAAIAATVGLNYKWEFHIGSGHYAPPDSGSLRPHMDFYGSAMPGDNSTLTATAYGTLTATAPTRQVGGTIFTDKVVTTNVPFVRFFNLGVDLGPDAVSAGATPNDGFSLGSTDPEYPFTLLPGIEFHNVYVLGTPSAPYHCFVVENGYQTIYNNVKAVFNYYGIAEKGYKGQILNSRFAANLWSAVIAKSDALANNYGTVIDNAQVTTYDGYDAAGIVIQSASASNKDVIVRNSTFDKTTFGIRLDGALVGGNENTYLSNNTFNLVETIGTEIANGKNFVINGGTWRKSGVQNIQAIGDVGPGIIMNTFCDSAGINNYELSTTDTIILSNVIGTNATIYNLNSYTSTIKLGSYYVNGAGVADTNGLFIPLNPEIPHVDTGIEMGGLVPAVATNNGFDTASKTWNVRYGSRIYKFFPADSLTIINFETTTNVYEPEPGVWANATGGAYGHLGLSSTPFVGDGRLIFSGTSRGGILGLSTTNAQEGYEAMEAAMVIVTDGTIVKVDNGTASGSLGAIAASDLCAIYRSGSVIKLQKSVDNGNNWTDIVTFTFSTTDTLYIVCDISGSDVTPPDGGRIINPILK